jgi:pyruvate/2-oxoglutarate dehydrogenase complex dihydrolipoamide dehydrogenase (E3) component
VLTRRKRVNGNVIIIGGGMVGCETAEFLSGQEGDIASVTVLEMLERMAGNVSATYRPFFLARLKKSGVRMKTQARVTEINEQGVTFVMNGKTESIKGDAVVIAAGYTADSSQIEKFLDKAPEVYTVGDCKKARMIKEAIEEGFEAGRRI